MTLGSAVVAAAMGDVSQSNGSAYLGSTAQAEAAGVQVSLVYAAVASSGSCPAFQGVNEGTSLTVALFDYGTVGFVPAEFVVNSTVYFGSYPSLNPGTMGQYPLTLASCSHPSGLTVVAVDARGDEVQFEV